tara:strand:+ start:232 stop:726 length:495 start_codon:yes stop_codon:yes gene_type:complete
LEKILIAKIQAHQGLNGWLKIYSYSETKEKFSNYTHFFVLNNRNYNQLDIEDIKIDKSIKIKFRSINSREDAERFIDKSLYIEADQLEKLNDNEYYWKDLIGLDVYIEEGEKIGVISDIIETGSNDVLVIQGEKELLVPYIYGQSIKNVFLNDNKVVIDKMYYE